MFNLNASQLLLVQFLLHSNIWEESSAVACLNRAFYRFSRIQTAHSLELVDWIT